jgi:hypothetical protein
MLLLRSFPALAVAGLLLASAAAADKPTEAAVLERLRKDLFFLASPECEGRGIETKGINKAADYIAERFKEAGLKPAGKDGSYFQPFTIPAGVKLVGTPKFSLIESDGGTRTLQAGTDFTALGFSSTGRVAAGLVFVGYGLTVPELKYDDYAGIDAAGKVVVLLRRMPRPTVRGDDRFDKSVPAPEDSPLVALQGKIDNAVAHKAAAVVVLNDGGLAGSRDPLDPFTRHALGTTPAPIPVLQLKRGVFESLLPPGPVKSLADIETLIDKDLKPRSFVVPGRVASLELTVDRTEYQVKNIVGVLDGSGPLADETVVIGAHYDHIGYGDFGSLGGPAAKGRIHLGADDNASGTATLIELARRYGALKDRSGRRLLFIAFSGEERGLLGSIHYCKRPLFPLEKTVAMINLDMVGRATPVPVDWLGLWGKKDRLVVYGTGTAEGFDQLVDSAGRRVEFRLTKIAAGTGPSDHDTFYRKKVPVLFLYTGTHPEYHRPTDVPEKINLPGLSKVADFVQVLVEELTHGPRPQYRVTRDAWTDPTEVRVARPQGPKLGVLPDYAYEGDGLRLEGVTPGGAAEKAGLQAGDVIVEIGGKPVKNISGYMTAMSGQKSGTPVEIVILRKEQKMTLKVTPE